LFIQVLIMFTLFKYYHTLDYIPDLYRSITSDWDNTYDSSLMIN
jgi:hypothetical protein